MTDVARPTVSVVIVHYNGEALLDACLKSVYGQPYRPIEVIVVDNGSADDSVAMVQRKYPDVRLSVEGQNLGYAEGNNRGVELAKGEYVVLLNSDTEVTADWLPGLLELMRDPRVGVVTSKVVTDGVPQRFYTMNGSLNALGHNIMRVFTDLSSVFFAGGASVMFRRTEVARPFLPEYFLYHEDVYLSWRMRLAGRDVRMAQRSLVHHRGSATTRRHAPAFVTFYQERNRILNALILYETGTLVRLLPLFLCEGAAKLVWSILTFRKSPVGIMRAYGWIISHQAWIRTRRAEHQSARKVRDTEILSGMSGRLLDGEGVMAVWINAIVRAYSRIMGLRFHD